MVRAGNTSQGEKWQQGPRTFDMLTSFPHQYYRIVFARWQFTPAPVLYLHAGNSRELLPVTRYFPSCS